MTHNNIYEAMNAVMQGVGYVQKQRSANLNYSFAGEAALIAAIRPLMVENDIVVHPAGVHDLTIEQFENKNKTLMTRVCGIFNFTFYHGPSQTGFTVEVVGEGVDSGDKAANKAMTAAFKYALRQSFMIETGDDPDATPSSDYERGPSVRGAQPTAKPAAATTEVPKDGHGPKATGRAEAAGFPPDDALLSECSGVQLHEIQEFGYGRCGMDHKKHFENRWKQRYGVKTLKDIPGTVGEFLAYMAQESDSSAEFDEAFPRGKEAA